MQPIWIKRFLDPLIENGCDYVTPLYKRSRYEGSTTNHFAFPLIYDYWYPNKAANSW